MSENTVSIASAIEEDGNKGDDVPEDPAGLEEGSSAPIKHADSLKDVNVGADVPNDGWIAEIAGGAIQEDVGAAVIDDAAVVDGAGKGVEAAADAGNGGAVAASPAWDEGDAEAGAESAAPKTGRKRKRRSGSESDAAAVAEKPAPENADGGSGARSGSGRSRSSLDGILGARKKKNRRAWSAGHISAADAKVSTLPPIPPCTAGDGRRAAKKKKSSGDSVCDGDASRSRSGSGCCFQCPRVTDDPAFQRRLRDLYVAAVRDAPESGHAVGTGLLASMLRPHIRDPREIIRKKLAPVPGAATTCMWCRRNADFAQSPKHKFGEDTCSRWESALAFCRENGSDRMLPRVPWIAEDGTRDGTTFEIHVETFKRLFDISQGRLNHIRRIAKGGATSSAAVGDPGGVDLDALDKRRKGSGGHNRLRDDQVKGLLLVLRDAPCRTDPFTREYHFGSDLSLAYFWKRYLKSTGIDGTFLEQSERMNFYPTYDRVRRNRKVTEEMYREDPEGKRLLPSVSYTAAIEVYARCNIHFDLIPGEDDPRRSGVKRVYSRKKRGGTPNTAEAASDAGRSGAERGSGDADGNDDAAAATSAATDSGARRASSTLRLYHPGMVKECVCSRGPCPGSSLPFVVVNRGFTPPGSDHGFDWAKELVTRNRCPGCGQPSQVTNVGFVSCRFRCEWMEIGKNKLFETRWKAVRDDVFYFTPDDDTEYQYMTIYVE